MKSSSGRFQELLTGYVASGVMGRPILGLTPSTTEAEAEARQQTVRIRPSTPQVFYKVYNSSGDSRPRYLRHVEVISRWTSAEINDVDHKPHIRFGRLHLIGGQPSISATWEWWLDEEQS
jgi:hypothetical protein